MQEICNNCALNYKFRAQKQKWVRLNKWSTHLHQNTLAPLLLCMVPGKLWTGKEELCDGIVYLGGKKEKISTILSSRHGRTRAAHCRESQEVWMAHNIWKDLNFEIGWLLNCCNHGFSGFLLPQQRQMKNNISQSLDLESFLCSKRKRKRTFSDIHA